MVDGYPTIKGERIENGLEIMIGLLILIQYIERNGDAKNGHVLVLAREFILEKWWNMDSSYYGGIWHKILPFWIFV